jgi:hypothetical protein
MPDGTMNHPMGGQTAVTCDRRSETTVLEHYDSALIFLAVADDILVAHASRSFMAAP